MRIAVVDDERTIREQVGRLVKKYSPACILEEYGTGGELLASTGEYDIVFLDIQMEGMNGIDTARALRRRQEDVVLIFITGVKDYVWEAFDVSAFHYLLKPIEEKKLAEVLKRAGREAEKRRAGRRETIFIKTKNRGLTIGKSDILYIESQGRKVEIHTKTEVVEAYAAMRELEQQLGGGFFRCHRGYLVNLAYIAEYETDGVGLNNGEKILLAKGRYGEFVREYMRYLKNGGTACV